jgi:chitooligosaccharide deacetylase
VAALTFDDGPDPVITPALLDLLAAHRARASFFLLGERVETHRELVDRIRREGHEVCSHTWSHRSLKFESPPGGVRALVWCWRQVRRGCGATRPAARFVRPPYGHETVAARFVAALLGARMIGWSLTAGDFQGDEGEEIAIRIVSRLQPGSIVLLHDWLAGAEEPEFLDRDPTLQAVARVLQRSDYRFVTISQLLDTGLPRLRFVPSRPKNQLATLSMRA